MYMSGELSVCVFCILSREFLKQFFREMVVICLAPYLAKCTALGGAKLANVVLSTLVNPLTSYIGYLFILSFSSLLSPIGL